MLKFIHTADIHLDSPLHRLEAYDGAPVDEIRQASRRAFENLIDLALDAAVDFVLIAGDLFDGDWKDYNTGLYFISQVSRLKDAGIAVFIVSGNHDAAGRMTRTLPYPENVHVFSHRKPETRRLEAVKVAVHGHSFASAAVMENLAIGYPEPVPGWFNIGLLHTSLTGREGHENYAPCTVSDLETRGYDYWALGHVHRFECVSEDPPVVFPGCIQGRHIKEDGTKGCVLVTVAEGAAPEVVRQPLDVIRWEPVLVDTNGADTQQACIQRLTHALQPHVRRHDPLPVIARITFTGETEAHAAMVGDLDHWKQVVRSAALSHFGERAWVEKVNVNTRLKSSRGVTSAAGPLTELERLVAEITDDGDSLLSVGDELSDLFNKLPPEYRQGHEALSLDDPACLRRIVDQAHALLVRGLSAERPDS